MFVAVLGPSTALFLTDVSANIKVHSWFAGWFSRINRLRSVHCEQGTIIISLHITGTHWRRTRSQLLQNTDRLYGDNVEEISGKHRTARPPSATGGDSESGSELWGHSPPWRILQYRRRRVFLRHNRGRQRQTENYRWLRRTKFSDHSELALCKGLLQNDATNASKWERRSSGPVRVRVPARFVAPFVCTTFDHEWPCELGLGAVIHLNFSTDSCKNTRDIGLYAESAVAEIPEDALWSLF